MEHHRIILSGPSGTGKTYLANKLAEYIITKSGRKKTEDAIATFNVDHNSSKVSHNFLWEPLLFIQKCLKQLSIKIMYKFHIVHEKFEWNCYLISLSYHKHWEYTEGKDRFPIIWFFWESMSRKRSMQSGTDAKGKNNNSWKNQSFIKKSILGSGS